jgi:hypothetical protein
VWIQTRQQASSGRATTCSVVELGESQPVLGKRIEVLGADLPAVATKVRDAHIVAEDNDEVGHRLFAMDQGTDTQNDQNANDRIYGELRDLELTDESSKPLV